MARFVHLHVHTHYSLLDSIVKVDALVDAVKANEMQAVAVTDHCRMFGALEFQNRAKKAGIRAIHGVALQVPALAGEDAEAKPDHQLVLLAENLTGYKNLLQIVSHAWLDAVGTRIDLPISSWERIRTHSEGLIALSGDIGGEIATWILRRDEARAEAAAHALSDIFGPNNFFIEVQRHEGIPEQQEACEGLIALARKLALPIVATNNVHYLNKGDHIAHGILMCVGMEKRVSQEILEKIPIQDLYLRTPGEMEELFEDVPDAIMNTVAIAERCDVTIPTGTYHLPDFDVPDGFDINSFMHDRALDGLETRFAEMTLAAFPFDREAYIARLDMECAVISGMGYAGYFLIVWDFILWARIQGIPVGPGRGSGAGSIVAWSLRITDINPMRYGLLFERFLNPERVSMPDFDIDFCQTRRGEVIQYVGDKYGRNNVGMIVTFGQLKAKAVVKDVARVLNLSFADSNKLSALIPADPTAKTKLRDIYDNSEEFRNVVNQDDRNKFLYKMSLALEGNVRNTGMHAAGVVIGRSELWNYVPIVTGAQDEIVTQFAKDEVEQAGLVKFDFLGLKNLTVIHDALEIIERSTGRRIDFNTVDLNDPKTYHVMQTGDTAGIFQMESEGFQRLVRRLRPDVFEDVIAVVALYRPGPLGSGMVDTYIECKHGRKEPDYLHPLLEGILTETFGVMVYQEQVMQAAQLLAGYSLGGADLLRRAMGKKMPEEMAKQRTMFVEGASARGVPESKSQEIFDLIVHFAGYGFNKSHSAAYAMVTFQTAYLKAHYPAAFYAALMTSDAGRADKVSIFIMDARHRGIQVLPPDINQSDLSFTVTDGAIRFGLSAIKGLGDGPIEEVEAVRADGPFVSIFDFCDRVSMKKVSKRALDALIRAGAFDSLHVPAGLERSLLEIGKIRARLIEAIDSAVARGQQSQQDKESGQANLMDLFAAAVPDAPPVEVLPQATPWSDRELLAAEKELLGVYVSGHPLDRYRTEIQLYADGNTSQLESVPARQTIRIAGMIAAYEEKTLRDGVKKMAFFRLEDLYGEAPAMVYSSKFDEVRERITTEEPVIVTCQVRPDSFGEEPTLKLVVEDIQPLWLARQNAVNRVRLGVDMGRVTPQDFDRLVALIDAHPGKCRLELRLLYDQATLSVDIPDDTHVSSGDEFLRAAELLLGEGMITLA